MRQLARVVACVVLVGSVAAAQGPAVKEALQHYYDYDLRSAEKVLKAAHEKSPDDLELSAWLVFLQLDKRAAQSVIGAMKQKSPEDSWTQLATAAVTPFAADSVCEKAVQASKSDASVLTLATAILVVHAREALNPDSLKAFVERHRADYEQSAQALVAEAWALRTIAAAEHDTTMRGTYIELYNKALKLDPENLNATLALATQLRGKSAKDAYEFLKGAAGRFPDSYPVHLAYWQAAADMPNGKDLKKDILADAVAMLERAEPPGRVLVLLFGSLNEAAPDVAEAIGNATAKKYPDSVAADLITLQQATKDLPMATVEQNDQAKIKSLRALLARPRPLDKDVAANASSQLLYLLTKQENPDLEEIYKLAEKPGDMYWSAINKLADAKYRLPDLERIAAAQLDLQWTNLRDFKKEQRDGSGFVDFWLSDRVHFWLDSLGYIYLQQGRFDDAEPKLDAALKLYSKDALCNVHRGKLYEAKQQYGEAEKTYLAALSMPYQEADHPAVASLRELYVRQHGSADGLEAYMKPILAEQLRMRREQVLSARASAPKPMPSFILTALDGSKLDSGSLMGRILVINFWATWCGPCRKELPDYQKFYDKHKNDPHVAVLTIATDVPETSDSVIANYVKKSNFSFPVLRGPEYATNNRINAIPLTWFVDPDGKIAFQKLGATRELVEEFDWRVDALRQSGSGKPKAAGSSLGQ